MKTSLRKDTIPSYIGVYNSLYSDLTHGIYPVGSRLPGEIALAEKYKVSRNTLRQALAILNEDGLIFRSQGKDTIVTSPGNGQSPRNISNPMITYARFPITDIKITYNYGSPTDIAKSRLHLTDTDLILASSSVFYTSGQIIGYSFTQLPAKYFPVLNLNPAETQSIETATMHTIFQYAASSEQVIKLIRANETKVSFLGVGENTPLFLIESILYRSESEPFARCKFYILPDYYRLNYTVMQKNV